jgi:TRAP-type C4-dicarboxylate transport system substrate-binding protein
MKKWLIMLVPILILSFILTACSSSTPSTTVPATSSAPAKPATSAPASSTTAAPAPASTTASTAPAANVRILKFSYDMPSTSAIVPGWTWWADQLQKQTNGAYKIDFYGSGSMVKPTDEMNALSSGIVDIQNVTLTTNIQAYPLTNVLALPSTHFPDTLAGFAAERETAKQLLVKFPSLAKEFSQYKMLGWHVVPANIMMSKKAKLAVPADVKGLKVGAQGLDLEVVKACGGAPVMIAGPQMYENIDKGVIDVGMTGWVQTSAQKLYEVNNNFLDYGFGQLVQMLDMNMTTWNSLPPNVQKIMLDLTAQMENIDDQAYLKDVENGRKMAKDKGCTIVVPAGDQRKQWDAICTPVDQVWLDNMKSKNITDAQAVLDFVKQQSAAAWAKNP